MRKAQIIPLMCVVTALALSVAAWGQDKETAQRSIDHATVLKIIQTKYVDPGRLRALLLPFAQGIFVNDKMKVLTVTDTPERVEIVEEAIKKLDVPPPRAKNVEITGYFLLAKRRSSEAADLPPALKEVLAELKGVLNYQGFSLLNTAIVRTQDDEGANVKGAAGGDDLNDTFQLGFQRLNIVAGESSPVIRLTNLDFRIQDNGRYEQKDSKGFSMSSRREPATLAQIHTDIDIPVGQKVVVGKTAFGSPDNALVLVLTAQVMD